MATVCLQLQDVQGNVRGGSWNIASILMVHELCGVIGYVRVVE